MKGGDRHYLYAAGTFCCGLLYVVASARDEGMFLTQERTRRLYLRSPRLSQVEIDRQMTVLVDS